MHKPEDVPQDVWDAAHEEVEAMPDRPPFKVEVQQAIARAILAERERCANICDVFIQSYDEEIAYLGLEQPKHGSPAKYAVKCISEDIRNPS